MLQALEPLRYRLRVATLRRRGVGIFDAYFTATVEAELREMKRQPDPDPVHMDVLRGLLRQGSARPA
jgi:hypothetical protein